MSDSSVNPDSVDQIKSISPDDEKTFTVCILNQDWDTAPVLGPKRVLDMSADGATTTVDWQGDRHLWFHCARGTTGCNDFATILASKLLTGQVYIVATASDHSMMDFPADIFDIISATHARRPPPG